MPRTQFAQIESSISSLHSDIDTFAGEHNVPLEHFKYPPLKVHPVAKSAVRKIIILQSAMLEFMLDVKTVMSNHGYPNDAGYYSMSRLALKYPVIWNADKSGCIMYPNLPLTHFSGDTSSRNLTEENPWFPRYSRDIVDSITTALTDEKRSQAWTPVSRGIKRLNSRNTVSVSRALARAITFDGKPIEDAQYIDNTSQHLIELNAPSTFVFADTVEEIRTMYTRVSSETPSSCMDSKHGFALRDSARPVDFYGYCPNSRGAYITRGGTVLARTMCWLDSKTKMWHYTRVYSARGANAKELIEFLNKEGIKSHESGSRIRSYCEFNIPYHDTDYSSHTCPMPYFDFFPSNWVGLKHSENGWLVKMGKNTESTNNYLLPNLTSTSGFFAPSEYHECDNCGSTIDSDDEYHNVAGSMYCSVGCATDRDCSFYYTSVDEELRHADDIPDTAIQGWTNCTYFSNRHAALRRSMRFHPVPWAATEGDLFVALNDATDFGNYCQYVARAEMEVSPNDYMRQTLYTSCEHVRVQNNENWKCVRRDDDKLEFLTMGILKYSVYKSTVSTVTHPCASTEGNLEFCDSLFDSHVQGMFNTPAPLDNHAYLYHSDF